MREAMQPPGPQLLLSGPAGRRLPGLPVLVALGLALASPVCQARDCALTVAELRALVQQPVFPLRWQETTMQDDKPLVVTLSERDGGLHLQFVKSREGLWAEGAASVCMNNGTLEAVLSRHRISVGPAAHWLLRQSLAYGARFVLAPKPGGQLHIETPGWSGTFVPARD
jgi:hypothetical protein